jgi:hypothetical protein
MFGGHVDVHLVWELSEARPLRRNLLNNMYDGRKHEQAKANVSLHEASQGVQRKAR